MCDIINTTVGDYMILNADEAKKLLDKAKGYQDTDLWIKHCYLVGEVASTIAKNLNLDSEKAMTLGYIHDIGKAVGPMNEHITNGYKYLKSLGYDDEYCNICLVHSYLNNDTYCASGGICKDEKLTKWLKNHEYTIYEKIINIADLLCTDKICTLEERLKDIEERYGKFDNSSYHKRELYKLKKEFDDMLGFDLYKLFFKKNKKIMEK